MLPQIMEDRLKFLEENNFIIKEPTSKAIELRELAVEFVNTENFSYIISGKKADIIAVTLTGSSVGGYSGDGSDIDLNVLTRGKTRCLVKKEFKDIPIDLQFMSFEDWKDECINNGESARYITHTVAIADTDGKFLEVQLKLLNAYYSPETMKARYDLSSKIVLERSKSAIQAAEKGELISAAIKMDSALYEAVSHLIYRYKGITATSLMLLEFERLSRSLNHPEWFYNAMDFLRFNISKSTAEKKMKDYKKIYSRMRELIEQNRDILTKMNRRNLVYFSDGNQLVELCSETDYQQTYDKIYRALAKNNTFDAGLNLWFGTHYNFFMFSPFFYFKNVNRNASAKEFLSKSFQELYGCWDGDIRGEWSGIYGVEALTKEMFTEAGKLCNEILLVCKC